MARDCTVEVPVWKLEEKQSDVNLALHAFKGALIEGIEHVVIVTNDTDIAPALAMLRAHTRAIVGLVVPTRDHQRPPNRDLTRHAHWVRSHITPSELQAAQLPRVIPAARNPVLKPDSWYARPDLLEQALALACVEKGSRSKAFQWLETPNPHWNGSKPIELLESDAGEQVIAFMQEWGSRKPVPSS